MVEHTNSWHNRGFKKLHICTEKRALVIQSSRWQEQSSSPAASSAKPSPTTAGTQAPTDAPNLSAQPLSLVFNLLGSFADGLDGRFSFVMAPWGPSGAGLSRYRCVRGLNAALADVAKASAHSAWSQRRR